MHHAREDTTHDVPRPYPRLSEEQMDRLLPQVAQYFAALKTFRPAGGTDEPTPLRRGEVQSPSYETDFYAWTQQQAQAIRAKDVAAMDIEHVAEEIDDLGANIQHAITSQLERLLLHLLKWRYDPAQDPRRGWRVSILDARHEIAKHLRRNPSLRDYPAQEFPDAYRYARRVAALETDLPLDTFPEACPWTVDQVLDEDFLPEA
jgi:Domain of unknown function DUF29